MDKFEYKVRADEIKALIAEGDYGEAVKIADTIDWRRVKSVMMLCTISDLYKINRRYQESKDILLMAYEKHPAGRLIVYSLCELSIKMEEYVQAIEYLKEFSRIAPRDTGKYILQYRLFEAQDATLEERIAILEEFKKRDYREKWAYELAYLYHRVGLETKCVEECDEMYLWFGEGRYVLKALELKALHTPLSAEQQSKYDMWIMERDAEAEEEDEEIEADEEEEDEDYPEEDMEEEDEPDEEEDEEEEDETEVDGDTGYIPTTELPLVKTIDMGQYNTMNLQMALAESMKEILSEDDTEDQEPDGEETAQEVLEEDLQEIEIPAETQEAPAAHTEPVSETVMSIDKDTETETGISADVQIQKIETEPVPVSKETVREDRAAQETDEGGISAHDAAIVEKIIAPLFQETKELPRIRTSQAARELPQTGAHQPTDELQEVVAQDAQAILNQMKQETITARIPAAQVEAEAEKTASLLSEIHRPSKYDNVLAQENDGQIRLVVPDAKAIEKQITGQLSIEEVLAEWEATKRSNEQKRMEDVRQRIMESTGSLFADFDEATKSGLLEQLEKAFVAAILKESGKQPSIKKVVLADTPETERPTAPQPKPQQAPPPVKQEEALPIPEPEPAEEPAEEEKQEPVVPSRPKPKTKPKREKVIPKPVEEEVTAQSVPEEEPDLGELENLEELAELAEITAPETESEEAAASEPEAAPKPRFSHEARELTDEEKELFGQYIHHRKSREQLINTLDNMSMAAYTGNVIITGEEGGGTLSLAKGLIREMQYNDSNFSGKVAKITGTVLNKKNIGETLGRISSGALIIEKASGLKEETVAKLGRELERDNIGLLIIMEDTKQAMNRLLAENAILNNSFNLRIDIEPLDDEALVAYARQYAEEMEYSIDEFGVLALHTRIADMQTSDHEVSVAEVRELVDEAIYYANRKTPRHFMDILLAKRYDNEDMIILRENDFMHY